MGNNAKAVRINEQVTGEVVVAEEGDEVTIVSKLITPARTSSPSMTSWPTLIVPYITNSCEVMDGYDRYDQSLSYESNVMTSDCSFGSRDSLRDMQMPNDHTFNAERRSSKKPP